MAVRCFAGSSRSISTTVPMKSENSSSSICSDRCCLIAVAVNAFSVWSSVCSAGLTFSWTGSGRSVVLLLRCWFMCVGVSGIVCGVETGIIGVTLF